VNLVYLLLVGAIVSLGVRFVGTLLMGALVIVPAVSARNVTKTITGYLWFSAIFGVVSAATGIFLAVKISLPVGAMVVLSSVTIYVLSYLLKNRS
jgi:zinc transport system permease protein